MKATDDAIKLILGMPKTARKAASMAINRTLLDIQGVTGKELLPDKFTLRGRGKQWWQPGQKFGFNVRPFSNPDTLSGTLGSGADWLKLHEQGGTKQSSEHRLAIPTQEHKPKAAMMTRELKPKALRKQYDVFAATIHGKAGLFRRAVDGLSMLFSFNRQAAITPTLKWEASAKDLVDAKYESAFTRAFLEQNLK